MACCMTAPSHYLNICWFLFNGILWHSPRPIFASIRYHEFKIKLMNYYRISRWSVSETDNPPCNTNNLNQYFIINDDIIMLPPLQSAHTLTHTNKLINIHIHLYVYFLYIYIVKIHIKPPTLPRMVPANGVEATVSHIHICMCTRLSARGFWLFN